MSESFETRVTVKTHAKYGSFQSTDGQYYKPVGQGLTLEQFVPGQSYGVKGYLGQSGKTKYITMIVNAGAAESVKSEPVPVKTFKKKFTAPKQESGRDFVKEAKGKTYSLLIKGLLHTDLDASTPEGRKVMLEAADALLKGIEARGYF